MVPKKRCTGHSDGKKLLICSETGLLAVEGACPNVDVVYFDKDDKDIPTKYCTKHKKSNKKPNNNTTTNRVTPDPEPTNTVVPDPEPPAPVNNTVVTDPDPDVNETTGT